MEYGVVNMCICVYVNSKIKCFKFKNSAVFRDQLVQFSTIPQKSQNV